MDLVHKCECVSQVSKLDTEVIVHDVVMIIAHVHCCCAIWQAVAVTCGVFGGDESEALYIADEIKALQTGCA